MRTVVFDISGHGLGHLAQIGCVVGRLLQTRSDIRVILRSAHAPELVKDFCGAEIEPRSAADEPTLVMRGPVTVDRVASAAAYDAFHADWESEIAVRAAALSALGPDLLVSDIPYASLAAAARLSLPAIALCSLNWRDLRAAYCGADDAIARAMEAAYQSARAFLQPAPHMPMGWLRNAEPIGPIGRRGVNRASELRERLCVGTSRKIVLVSFGGIAGGPSFDFARAADLFFITPMRSGANVAGYSDAGLPMIDLLASVDAVVTKDGYATLVEAAVNGVRVLMLARRDWPETPHFIEWGARNACFKTIPVESDAATVIDSLRELLAWPQAAPVESSGTIQAAERIRAALAM